MGNCILKRCWSLGGESFGTPANATRSLTTKLPTMNTEPIHYGMLEGGGSNGGGGGIPKQKEPQNPPGALESRIDPPLKPQKLPL